MASCLLAETEHDTVFCKEGPVLLRLSTEMSGVSSVSVIKRPSANGLFTTALSEALNFALTLSHSVLSMSACFFAFAFSAYCLIEQVNIIL